MGMQVNMQQSSSNEGISRFALGDPVTAVDWHVHGQNKALIAATKGGNDEHLLVLLNRAKRQGGEGPLDERDVLACKGGIVRSLASSCQYVTENGLFGSYNVVSTGGFGTDDHFDKHHVAQLPFCEDLEGIPCVDADQHDGSLAVLQENGALSLFDCSQNTPVCKGEHDVSKFGPVQSLRYKTAHPGLVVVGSGSLFLHDVRTSETTVCCLQASPLCSFPCVEPDVEHSHQVAAGTGDGKVVIWDWRNSSAPVLVVEPHGNAAVSSILCKRTFSGEALLSAGYDGSLAHTQATPNGIAGGAVLGSVGPIIETKQLGAPITCLAWHGELSWGTSTGMVSACAL